MNETKKSGSYNKKQLASFFALVDRGNKAQAERVIKNIKKDDNIKELLKRVKISARGLKEDESNYQEIIFKHYQKHAEQVKKEISDLLTDESIQPFKRVELSAEWTKSRTWGYCPTAEGWINNKHLGTARASGCGYDKLSSVYNTLMKNDKSFKKAVIIQALKSKAQNKTLAYSVQYNEYGIYAWFSGRGVEALRSILIWLGFKRENIKELEGKSYNYFEATR